MLRELRMYSQFSINVWAGIISDKLIGPYRMPYRLTSESYLQFLHNDLSIFLEHFPLETCLRMFLPFHTSTMMVLHPILYVSFSTIDNSLSVELIADQSFDLLGHQI